MRGLAVVGTVTRVDDDLISRDELTATLCAINDIRNEELKIRRVLEEEGDGDAPEDDA